MTVAMEQQKKLHFELTNVGMRAQATAAGMVQLCRELHRAGILDNDALERIKADGRLAALSAKWFTEP